MVSNKKFIEDDTEEVNDYSMTKEEAKWILKVSKSRYTTSEVVKSSEVRQARKVLKCSE